MSCENVGINGSAGKYSPRKNRPSLRRLSARGCRRGRVRSDERSSSFDDYPSACARVVIAKAKSYFDSQQITTHNREQCRVVRYLSDAAQNAAGPFDERALGLEEFPEDKFCHRTIGCISFEPRQKNSEQPGCASRTTEMKLDPVSCRFSLFVSKILNGTAWTSLAAIASATRS